MYETNKQCTYITGFGQLMYIFKTTLMTLFQQVCVVLCPEILKFSCPEFFLLCPVLKTLTAFSLTSLWMIVDIVSVL